MYKSITFKLATAAILALSGSLASAEIKNVGKKVTEADLVNWDISVGFEGNELPAGSGTLEQGEEIWLAQCAMCHGEFGEGARGYPKMLGDTIETLQENAKVGDDSVGIRGINNFWGHAPTLFDYIRRAMPFFAPQSLSNDQTYAVTGYVLYLAELIEDEPEKIDADYLRKFGSEGNGTLPATLITYTDTRPDVKGERCMKDCHDGKLDIGEMAVIGDVAVGKVKKVGEAAEEKK